MVLIDSIVARQILNGQGEPTVETILKLSSGEELRASVPSGRTKSSYEAIELYDKDFAKYFGRSVEHAVESINNIIAPRIKRLDPTEQSKVDQILLELDGTPNKAHLGSNVTLAVSVVVARAAAKVKDKPFYSYINELFIKTKAKNQYDEDINLTGDAIKPQLPIPGFSLINGGSHASSTDLTIQEFLVFPVGVDKMADKIRAGVEILNTLKKLCRDTFNSGELGDEGALAPPRIADPMQAMEIISQAVKKSGYDRNNRVVYGFDIAGAEIPAEFYSRVFSMYPVLTVEDPYKEDDWDKFTKMHKTYPDLFVTGDDLTATQLKRLYTAIKSEAIDSVMVKPNQAGTLTETLQFAKVAKDAGMALYAAHRSGETSDTFIVDLAVGIGAKFLKAGAPFGGERVAKYNHLMDVAVYFES
ncbi:hypothetical protein HGA91_03065 [candidate division WWE3 bacterium]|nr:hypothetical protein [candidate division WWE3 bacterium]